MNDIKLHEWERGIRFESRTNSELFAFLWFYEWHLFDAVCKGEHTRGDHKWNWDFNTEGTQARMDADCMSMDVQTNTHGADLALTVHNKTDYDWPEIAAIIPCFNPGDPLTPELRNALFLDEGHVHTYFRGENGLMPIKGAVPREIHFNHQCKNNVMAWDKENADGSFVFDSKWPTSNRDAYAGVMIRESSNRHYVMGIAWESFLSAQGHNPWNCMHLSIKVGPLAQGASKTIHGKVYLFAGDKDACLSAFDEDFQAM